MMEKHKLNSCIDSPYDSRDYLYADVATVTTEKLPQYFRLNCLPVRNQLGLGCCVGEGGAAAQECDFLTNNQNEQLSELFLYAKCKEIDGLDTQGTYLRCLMKVLKDVGCVPLADYPFFDNWNTRNNTFPTISDNLLEEASARKIKKYARLETLNDIKKAIFNENGAILNTPVSDSYYEAQLGVIGKIYGKRYGYHCVAAIGWDDNKEIEYDYSNIKGNSNLGKVRYKGVLICKNSWGREWGEMGYFYIPYDVIKIGTEDNCIIREAWTTLQAKIYNPDYHKNNSSIYLELWLNSKKYRINGIEGKLDVEPIVKNERTLVPIRFIAEALKCNVNWEQIIQTAIITKGSKEIEITVGSQVVYVNDERVILDVKPEVINERILVPLRFVAETFECEVHWEQKEQKITILKNNTEF